MFLRGLGEDIFVPEFHHVPFYLELLSLLWHIFQKLYAPFAAFSFPFFYILLFQPVLGLSAVESLQFLSYNYEAKLLV